ncbi:FMR1-interacting protein NUFIP1-like [Dysidea avara]|uniref:FMR1-interacting protein NUFIP1-like n=1 Tax=Dysidea avara TaxID=196820 RepID=UPI003326F2BB
MATYSPMFDSQSGSFQMPVYRGPFPPALPYSSHPFNNPWMAQCMPPTNGMRMPFFQPPGPSPNLGYNNWRGMKPARGRGGRNYKQQQPWRQNRKQKLDNEKYKESNKDSGDFKCQPCESSFRTESDLNCHISQHRQCNQPGCHFMAINRVLKEHELIHTIPKELFFTSDEEIAKWREERRKKYPTNERVRLKLLEVDEKLERGETAKDDVYRYCKRGGAHRQHPAAKRGRGGRGRFQRSSRQDRGGRRSHHLKQTEVDGNDEYRLDQLANSLTKDKGISWSVPQKTKQPILRNNVKHKATLLEKLLAPEIRKEKNTILQCIRHIVKNNFFDIEEPNNVTAVERNCVDDQNVSESSLIPVIPHQEEQEYDNNVSEDKEDGEVPSDPETECVNHECLDNKEVSV